MVEWEEVLGFPEPLSHYDRKPTPEAPPLTQAQLKQATEIARCWGGNIRRVERVEKGRSPFDARLGVRWKTRVVHISAYPFSLPPVAALTHEMAHAFAHLVEPEEVSGEEEVDLLGWELCLAWQLGCSTRDFYRGHKGFGIFNNGAQLQDLKPHDRRRMMLKLVEHGRQLGIIDEANRPLKSVRTDK